MPEKAARPWGIKAPSEKESMEGTNMKFEHLRGSIVAMITPFHEDGSVNFEVLTDLLERQISVRIL